MAERTWAGLSPAQRDGQACVVCGRSVRVRGSVAVPVGRSSTGSQVFACVGGCAEHAVAAPGGQLVISDEAWAGAGAAFVAVVDRAGGELHRVWPDDVVEAIVGAVAPLVVAAELRRLAEEFERAARDSGRHGAAYTPEAAQGRFTALRDCAHTLRGRADELDPAGAAR